MRPIVLTVGPSAAPGTTSRPIRLDEWADAQVSVQVAVTGTVNFTVQHSFDEGPDSPITPIPAASMFWDTGLIPVGAIAGTTSISFTIAGAPLWIRLLLNSGSGSARIVVVQYNTVTQ